MAHVANYHQASGFLNLQNCHGEKARSSSQNRYALQSGAVPAITAQRLADSATTAPHRSAVDVRHRNTPPQVQTKEQHRASVVAAPINLPHEKFGLPRET